MNEEKWQEIRNRIIDQFRVEDEGEESESEGKGKMTWIIFQCPFGRLKIERLMRLKLLDRKAIASRRIGGKATEQKIYSENEWVSFIKIYKDQNGVFQEIDSSAIPFPSIEP